MIKQCIICGKEFETNLGYQKICSPECGAENTRRLCRERYIPREPVSKTCVVCGKDFATVFLNQVCCSKECARLHKNALQRARNVSCEPTRKPCAVCGKEFISNNQRKYCSDECRRKGKAATNARCRARRAAQRRKDRQRYSPPKIAPPTAKSIVETETLIREYAPPPKLPTPAPKPKPKIFIAAAEAEHRTPTTDELLDWIFDPNRKLSGVDSAQIML